MKKTDREQSVVTARLAGFFCMLCGLFLWWGAADAQTVWADDNNTYVLKDGAMLETSTSVQGGYVADPSREVIYYFQVSQENSAEAYISGYGNNSGNLRKTLTLPSQIEVGSASYTVVGVNASAFAGASDVAGVVFTSTYRKVGAQAFSGCPITSVSFNEGMTTLEHGAFYNCSQLEYVQIPYTVTSIGAGVFANCASMETITVDTRNQNYCADSGILYTKDRTELVQCPAKLAQSGSIVNSLSIGSAEFPVRVVRSQAFEGCKYLSLIESVYATVTTIGEKAFYNCTSLSSIRIPSTVVTIDTQAFSGCPYLVISCDKASAAEVFAQNNGISTSVTCTVRFYDGSSLIKTEEVPLGGSASAPTLSERSGYTLTWDKDYTNVQQNLDVYTSWKQNFTVTFKDAYSGQMAEITSYYGGSVMPPEWTRKGYMLGWDSTAYNYVTKNMTVNAVWLVSMTDGTITDDAPELGDTRTINYITYQVTRTTASDPRVKAVGCTKQTLTTLTIPATITFGGTKYKVTNIGKAAFRDMSKLTTLTIGKNVIKINKTAFYNCSKLKTITIKSKKIKSIGEKAFSKTYAKANVNVPNAYITKYKKYLLDAGLGTSAKVY